MTAAMSKRTQARNEKALQEMVKTVPGNDRCADCGARNPGWASWSLGIFLCLRCASLHRKLGTHISKVKSLSMDSWTNEQVEGMRRNGNIASNKVYNPRNSKPAIPLDVDEVDAALERFIRQKYDQQTFSASTAVRPSTRHDTGSTRSSDDQPPPLPPKPVKRFGFGMRSVSSALPSTKHSPISPPTSPDTTNGYPPPPPIRVNKQSRVFGASVGGGGENMESKLATLRDMGFGDEKRNSTILKGLNGNLERTIETLVRLGDGNIPRSRPRSPVKPRRIAVSQPAGPSQPFSSVGVEPHTTAASGISFNSEVSPASKAKAAPTSSSSPDPNERDTHIPPTQSHNPFDVPNSRSDTWPLDKAFENMQVSQRPPLFPNATGGYPIQPQHVEASRFQQSMTPPVPQLHQHMHTNPYAHQMPYQNNNYNPFLLPGQQLPPVPSESYPANTQSQSINNAYNPFFAPQPSAQQQHAVDGSVFQPSQAFASQQLIQQQQPYVGDQPQFFRANEPPQTNPFMPQQSLNNQPAYQYQQYPPQTVYQFQPPQVQPSGQFDKSSILALYNYPQLAPPPLPNGTVSSENQAPPLDSSTPSAAKPASKFVNQRSVTMPAQLVSGSRNPFHTSISNGAAANANSAAPAIPSGLSRHVSQESVDVGGFQSGRHSPDAFASLSARFVR
ncbi:MAG: hypothetical protein Q9212_003207 [Teloschistes hypoglaucus]